MNFRALHSILASCAFAFFMLHCKPAGAAVANNAVE
jgi:hypothetical protein